MDASIDAVVLFMLNQPNGSIRLQRIMNVLIRLYLPIDKSIQEQIQHISPIPQNQNFPRFLVSANFCRSHISVQGQLKQKPQRGQKTITLTFKFVNRLPDIT